MRLIELCREEIADQVSVQDKSEVRRNWLRAAVEELNERSLSDTRPPRRRSADHVVRFAPFWRRRSDAELAELLNGLAPYFRKWQNRKLAL